MRGPTWSSILDGGSKADELDKFLLSLSEKKLAGSGCGLGNLCFVSRSGEQEGMFRTVVGFLCWSRRPFVFFL